MLTSSLSLPSNATDKPHFLKERIIESFIFLNLDRAYLTNPLCHKDSPLKTPKILWYRTCVFVNFYFFLTTIAGFSEYKPMGLFSGRLILGVKNKLRNAWAYFRGSYIPRGRGGLFSGFYGIRTNNPSFETKDLRKTIMKRPKLRNKYLRERTNKPKSL